MIRDFLNPFAIDRCMDQRLTPERIRKPWRVLQHLDAPECTLISNLATGLKKRELFARLGEHLSVLASEVEGVMATGLVDNVA